MNVDQVLFWIRLIARAILEVLNGRPSRFKPERIQVWLGILARAALTAIEEVGAPPPERSGKASAGAVQGGTARRTGFWTHFKPERIQFWLELIARFALAVVAGISERSGEETGKSGETSGAPAPADTPASEEAENQGT